MMIRVRERTVFLLAALTVLGCSSSNGDDVAGDTGGALPPDAGLGATPSLVIGGAPLMLDEGGAAGTLSVRASRPIESNIEVTIAVSDPMAVSLSAPRVTLTPADAEQPHDIEVAAMDDMDTDNEMVTLTFSADGLPSATAAVTVQDDDGIMIVAIPSMLTIDEGRADTFAVRLGAEPSGPVTVAVAASDATRLSANPGTLMFTPSNWADRQMVSVTALVDDNSSDDMEDIILTAPNAPERRVPVTLLDGDELDLVLDPNALTLDEGGPQGMFTVRLNRAPETTLRVEIQTSNFLDARVFPPSVQFGPNNWDMPETVTLTPGTDNDTMDETVRITLRTPLIPPRELIVTIRDADQLMPVPDMARLSLIEGGDPLRLKVALSHNPFADARVFISSSDPLNIEVMPGFLDFTTNDWGVTQEVFINARNDADTEDGTADLTLRLNGAPNVVLPITIQDDDVQAILPDPTAIVVEPSDTATLAVSLAFTPSADVQVDLQLADPAAGSLSQTSVQFVADQAPTPVDVFFEAAMSTATTTLELSATGLDSVSVPVRVDDTVSSL